MIYYTRTNRMNCVTSVRDVYTHMNIRYNNITNYYLIILYNIKIYCSVVRVGTYFNYCFNNICVRHRSRTL